MTSKLSQRNKRTMKNKRKNNRRRRDERERERERNKNWGYETAGWIKDESKKKTEWRKKKFFFLWLLFLLCECFCTQMCTFTHMYKPRLYNFVMITLLCLTSLRLQLALENFIHPFFSSSLYDPRNKRLKDRKKSREYLFDTLGNDVHWCEK